MPLYAILTVLQVVDMAIDAEEVAVEVVEDSKLTIRCIAAEIIWSAV